MAQHRHEAPETLPPSVELVGFYERTQKRIVLVDSRQSLAWSLSTDPTSVHFGFVRSLPDLPRAGPNGFASMAVYDRRRDEGLILPFGNEPAYKWKNGSGEKTCPD